MNTKPLSVAALLLAVAFLGCNDGTPTGPPPGTPAPPLCSVSPDDAVVSFEDANLEAAIRTQLEVGDEAPLTCERLALMTRLNASGAGIVSLAGIENLTGLIVALLGDNLISDIRPLSGLTNLRTLWLIRNEISSADALAGLISLRFLVIESNHISDISPLSGLTRLSTLLAYGNGIQDVSVLSNFPLLLKLDLGNNPIDFHSLPATLASTLEELSLGVTPIRDHLSLLSDFTLLKHLRLNDTNVINIIPLAGLINLNLLDLSGNGGLSDIDPLIANTGLRTGDQVNLLEVDPAMLCADVARLQFNGVVVSFTSCTGP